VSTHSAAVATALISSNVDAAVGDLESISDAVGRSERDNIKLAVIHLAA
jgi:hypothetical protein